MQVTNAPYETLYRNTRQYIEEDVLPIAVECPTCQTSLTLDNIDDLITMFDIDGGSGEWWYVYYRCPVCKAHTKIRLPEPVTTVVVKYLRRLRQPPPAPPPVPWWKRPFRRTA